MAKSIKLKNETYIDSSSVVHNRITLNNILKDTGWVNLPLENDATNFTWHPLRYRKMNGVVYFMGGIYLSNPSWAKLISKFPPGCRPVNEVDFVCRGAESDDIVIAINNEGNLRFLTTVTRKYSTQIGGIINGSFIADN